MNHVNAYDEYQWESPIVMFPRLNVFLTLRNIIKNHVL